MGDVTGISWAQHTYNPWEGCTRLSPACVGCYAAARANRFGTVEWDGPPRRTSIQTRNRPHRWNREAAAAGTRPFVFCASLADVFDKRAPAEWRRDLFVTIAATPNLIWLLLTKRPMMIVRLFCEAMEIDADDAAAVSRAWPSNACLGTTAEDQARWNLNVPALAEAKFRTGARMAFVSMEPLLERVHIDKARISPWLREHWRDDDWFDPIHPRQNPWVSIDWIITGGETDQGKHKARPSNPQWFREIRALCDRTETDFHHKQNGEWASVSEVEGPGEHFTFPDGRTVRKVGADRAGDLLDGLAYKAFPQVHTA